MNELEQYLRTQHAYSIAQADRLREPWKSYWFGKSIAQQETINMIQSIRGTGQC